MEVVGFSATPCTFGALDLVVTKTWLALPWTRSSSHSDPAFEFYLTPASDIGNQIDVTNRDAGSGHLFYTCSSHPCPWWSDEPNSLRLLHAGIAPGVYFVQATVVFEKPASPAPERCLFVGRPAHNGFLAGPFLIPCVTSLLNGISPWPDHGSVMFRRAKHISGRQKPAHYCHYCCAVFVLGVFLGGVRIWFVGP